MKEPHKRRCAVVGADFKSFVRPGTGRSKRHLRRPLDRVHHVLAGRVSRTNFNLLVVAAIPQVDAHAHVDRGASLAQLQPLVVPQLTHLWQLPLGIMIDPHSGQVGASLRAMKL